MPQPIDSNLSEMAHPHHFYRRWRGIPQFIGVIFRRRANLEKVTMAIMKLQRLMIAGGFAVAVAAAPVIGVFAVPTAGTSAPHISACPGGESEDTFTGECTPDLVPNSPEFSQTSPGGLPAIDNIPCTGGNSGQCIGLAEEQQSEGPQPVPHSSVSSSP
jgi:hypothetical protein